MKDSLRTVSHSPLRLIPPLPPSSSLPPSLFKCHSVGYEKRLSLQRLPREQVPPTTHTHTHTHTHCWRKAQVTHTLWGAACFWMHTCIWTCRTGWALCTMYHCTRAHTAQQNLAVIHTYILSPCLSLIDTLTLSPSLSHTHTHSVFFSLSVCLSLSLTVSATHFLPRFVPSCPPAKMKCILDARSLRGRQG